MNHKKKLLRSLWVGFRVEGEPSTPYLRDRPLTKGSLKGSFEGGFGF